VHAVHERPLSFFYVEKMIEIREEQPQDVEAIRHVCLQAFGQPQEGEVVERLRGNCEDLLSLVAVSVIRVVGHILFSPVNVEQDGKTFQGTGLAPMAVLPEFQRQGIGSELVKTGIARLKRMGCPFIIVLGHAEYYPRFGFEPASRYQIKSEWDVPDEAFMILVLDDAKMEGISGVAKYRPEFAEAM
jgi:putative acetyltransferase